MSSRQPNCLAMHRSKWSHQFTREGRRSAWAANDGLSQAISNEVQRCPMFQHSVSPKKTLAPTSKLLIAALLPAAFLAAEFQLAPKLPFKFRCLCLSCGPDQRPQSHLCQDFSPVPVQPPCKDVHMVPAIVLVVLAFWIKNHPFVTLLVLMPTYNGSKHLSSKGVLPSACTRYPSNIRPSNLSRYCSPCNCSR